MFLSLHNKTAYGIIMFTLQWFFLRCHHQQSFVYWPGNNTAFIDILWRSTLADTSTVLNKKEGNWILPIVKDSAAIQKTLTRHRKPKDQAYKIFLGRVDQEVLYEEGSILKEFYRFDEKGVLLLGYENRDSTRLLTVYTPPLLFLPHDLEDIDSTIVHETVPRVWNAIADTFKEEMKTRIRLKVEKRGFVWFDSSSVPAILCRMSLSQDGSIGFGGTDLIIPDATMMESTVLFAKGIGPVLEWGIRSSSSELNSTANPPADPRMDRMGTDLRLYLEIILHEKRHIQ